MYIGEGKVVQAQKSGTRVGVSPVDLGHEYVGAIRVLPPGTASRTGAAADAPGSGPRQASAWGWSAGRGRLTATAKPPGHADSLANAAPEHD